jgi:phosphoribulokinase
MKKAVAESEKDGGRPISHFGPEANEFEKLEALFNEYGKTGTGQTRLYLHNDDEAAPYKQKAGTFTPWSSLAPGSDLLFYEGLHGGVKSDTADVAKYVDLLVGVVPIVNLEWIQKIRRDTSARGYSAEAVTHTILRRMHDYVHYITPQFSHTHVNFQRVPTVDTSNPFVAREIPTLDESFVVIRFRDSKSMDFPYLLNMILGSFMSRPNTIVVPGGKMGLAIELILTPLILTLVAKSKK